MVPAGEGLLEIVIDGVKLKRKLFFVSSQHGDKARIVHLCLHVLGDRSSTPSGTMADGVMEELRKGTSRR